MDSSIFITAIAISVSYLLFRFVEMRLILKKNKPLKILARDTIIVYLSVLLGTFVMQQFGSNTLGNKITEVFTNNPEF